MQVASATNIGPVDVSAWSPRTQALSGVRLHEDNGSVAGGGRARRVDECDEGLGIRRPEGSTDAASAEFGVEDPDLRLVVQIEAPHDFGHGFVFEHE